MCRIQPLQGKTIGLIFEKSSTRTRVSFEVGMFQLGGHALFLSKNDIQLGRGETTHDTAKVLSRYLDGIMIRTFGHHNVTELAQHADIPVINGLSDAAHSMPGTRRLPNCAGAQRQAGRSEMAYIGDGNNMAHSLCLVQLRWGCMLR